MRDDTGAKKPVPRTRSVPAKKPAGKPAPAQYGRWGTLSTPTPGGTNKGMQTGMLPPNMKIEGAKKATKARGGKPAGQGR
jgi:hypothetical protein